MQQEQSVREVQSFNVKAGNVCSNHCVLKGYGRI